MHHALAQVLKREFLRYGDIASIKVMWPRDEEQRRRARNCGFVAYMVRVLGLECAGQCAHALSARYGSPAKALCDCTLTLSGIAAFFM